MKLLRQVPILRIVIPYFFGISLGLLGVQEILQFSTLDTILIFGGLIFLFSAFQIKTGRAIYQIGYGSLIFIFFALLGCFRWQETRQSNQSDFYRISENVKLVQLKVLDIPFGGNKPTTRLNCKIEGYYNTENRFFPAQGGVLVYIKSDSVLQKLQVGDALLINKKLNELPIKKNPWGFDYTRFLNLQNIYYQEFIRENNIIKIIDNESSWLDFIKNLRNDILQRLAPHFNYPNSFSVFAALVLGQKNFLENEVSSNYSSAGTMHVLAVSGLHVGILFFIVAFILKPMNNHRFLRWFSAVLQLCIIWFYACLTGLSPSIMRAATMFSFVILANQILRNSNIYNTLFISALFLTYFQPELLLSVGFQLSYLAVLGIVWIYPHLNSLVTFKNKILNYFWSLTCVSFAAQLAVLPLSLYYFNQMPTYFLLANWMVIPMATINLVGGLFASIFFKINEMNAFLAFILDHTLALQNYLVQLVSHLPHSTILDIYIPNYALVLGYLALISITAFLLSRNKIWLQFFFIVSLSGSLISLYIKTSRLNHSKVTLFHHPKSIYINYLTNGIGHTFCFGSRDLYFEENELKHFNLSHQVHSHHFHFSDTTSKYFGLTNSHLFIENLHIGIGKNTLNQNPDWVILNSPLSNIDALNNFSGKVFSLNSTDKTHKIQKKIIDLAEFGAYQSNLLTAK